MFYQNKIKSLTRTKNFSNFLISVLFILTFLLIFFNKADYIIAQKIKSMTIDIATPVTKIISFPIEFTSKTARAITEIRFLQKENLKLKEEVIRLKKWQTLAIKNHRENRAYRKLLNSTTNETKVIKTASVISHSPGIYSKSVLINAGLNQGILEDFAVINERGLVGKVISSSKQNSRIILINDQNSSVPVTTMSNNFYAIIKGTTDGKYLTSSFIKGKKTPKVGDLLFTSGSTKTFPQDLFVGKVIDVSEDNFLALPYVDFDNLEFVQVVKID